MGRRGVDIDNEVVFDIVVAFEKGDSKRKIAREFRLNWKSVDKLVKRKSEVKNLQLFRRRKGRVGPKPVYDIKGRKKLIKLNKTKTQKEIARLEGVSAKTIRK